MKQIETMTEQEKSVILAKLCEWETEIYQEYRRYYVVIRSKKEVLLNHQLDVFLAPDLGIREFFHNLYNPTNMALAWRVLNWTMGIEKSNFRDRLNGSEILHNPHRNLYKLPPEKAQKEILDKILSLAIETGMINDSK